MDLYAYTQIDKLREIAKENGISVPRLRGLRLMKNESIVTKDEINEMIHSTNIDIVKGLCRTPRLWDPNSHCHCYSYETDIIVRHFLKETEDNAEIRWDRIHGKKRRILKFEIKKNKRKYMKQYETFNKYAGREDVLYIHARIGGNNWTFYNGDNTVAKEPWFLEKVDDAWDSTYCDIYAKIKVSNGGDDCDGNENL